MPAIPFQHRVHYLLEFDANPTVLDVVKADDVAVRFGSSRCATREWRRTMILVSGNANALLVANELVGFDEPGATGVIFGDGPVKVGLKA